MCYRGEVLLMDVAIISDRGLVRQANEDSYIANPSQGLFVICDGMGGHRAGGVASHLVVEVFKNLITSMDGSRPRDILGQCVAEANRLILARGMENPEWHGMGTTVTAALLQDKHLTVANVGDSALFLVRGDTIRKITRDHTLAEEMVKDGLLKPEEIRSSHFNHILTRALGVEEEVEIDYFEEDLQSGDCMLLCSDGLSDLLTETDLADIMRQHPDLSEATRAMLKLALDRGGYDNITVILVRI